MCKERKPNLNSLAEENAKNINNDFKDNNDEAKTLWLDKRIKKLNKLYTRLNTEIEPFNKLSANFNELKN